MSKPKDKNTKDETSILSSEIVSKFDSVNFNICELMNKSLFDEEQIKEINYNLGKISHFMHSDDYNDVQEVIFYCFPRLAQVIQKHRLIDFLEQYKQIFDDYVIKIRSFPTSILNISDSGEIFGFYLQVQSLLIYLRNQKSFYYDFKIIHSLNFTITKINGIITAAMRDTNVGHLYYSFLSQFNEKLMNLQNVLNLVKNIENDSNFLLDIDAIIIRKLPEIEEKMGLKIMSAYKIK